ncbi:MAG TPA: hypothetical protein VGJ82_03440 [Thermoanaerobaculia bacterium]|jgi:hypothetical protein
MRSVAAIAVALLAVSAQAQVSEVIEVRVANVDVVVLDRAGKPITEVMQKKTAGASVTQFEKTRVVSAAENNIRTSLVSQTGIQPVYPMPQAYEDSLQDWTNYAADLRNQQHQLMSDVSSLFSVLAGSDRRKVFVFLAGELQETPGLDVLAQIDALFEKQDIHLFHDGMTGDFAVTAHG